MKLLKRLGAVASAFLGVVSVLVLIIKPVRSRFVNWVKKTSNSNENEKLLNELKGLLEKSSNQNESNLKSILLQNAALLCILRNTLTHMYYKYMNQAEVPIFERENLSNLYNAYHALNGNSYIDQCYHELMELPIKK